MMNSDLENNSTETDSEIPISSNPVGIIRVRSNSAGNLPLVSSWKPSSGSSCVQGAKPCLVFRDVDSHNSIQFHNSTNIESKSIASTAVYNAMNIVPKSHLSTVTATNLALEKVDLGGTRLPHGVLIAAGVPVEELSSINSSTLSNPTPGRRLSSQISTKNASHSRSPPPPAFYEKINDIRNDDIPSDLNCQSNSDSHSYGKSLNQHHRELSPLDSNFDSSSVTNSQLYHSSAPLAEAVVNAIRGDTNKLIHRSTSAATSYMASDEDNNQENEGIPNEQHMISNFCSRRRTKKHNSSLRKRTSNIHNDDNHNQLVNANDQDSGYGASNFSITSSGRSSVGANNMNTSKSNSSFCSQNKFSNGSDQVSKQNRHLNHRTVRIIDSKDSDEEDEDILQSVNTRMSPTELADKRTSGTSRSTMHICSNDEDEQFSLDDILNVPQETSASVPSTSQHGNQKHVTLDVRFADFADSDTSPPPHADRQSMSARNSTTGSECMCYYQQNRNVRNFSLSGDLNRRAFKSVSAGHSLNMTPSRQGSFMGAITRPFTDTEEPLISSEICCYYCYSMNQIESAFSNITREPNSEPAPDSVSSDEPVKKLCPTINPNFDDRRFSSGTQSISEPNNGIISSDRSCLNRAASVRSSDDYSRVHADATNESNRLISKWPYHSANRSHRSCQLHRNYEHILPGHNGENKRIANFLVDGVRFQVDVRLLEAHPDTMLGRMFCSGFAENINPSADIPLGMHSPDLSASVFQTVLDFYLRGKMTCPPDLDIHILKEACDYFLIPFNYRTVRCNNIRAFLHELSDDGAYRAFEGFFDMHILPKLVDCTRSGERECHLVVLMDDETINWDEEYPPQMPDNELNAHLIFSTQMYRFLKYNENREVAKKFLSSKYLKKIRIGIEGYPTYKERIKYRAHRAEVIYNYAQRPFIHMSWEHEENKSRHVDFQCVKSKSASDLATLEQVLGNGDPDVSDVNAQALEGTDLIEQDPSELVTSLNFDHEDDPEILVSARSPHNSRNEILTSLTPEHSSESIVANNESAN